MMILRQKSVKARKDLVVMKVMWVSYVQPYWREMRENLLIQCGHIYRRQAENIHDEKEQLYLNNNIAVRKRKGQKKFGRNDFELSNAI